MGTGDQFVGPKFKLFVAVLTVTLSAALPASAQFHGGPPSQTTVGGHFLAPPPSVTSIGGSHLPPPLPSVTSIPNFGSINTRGFHSPRHGRRGFMGGYAYGYSVPYYYYPDDSAYGYDYVGSGGSDLHSGPPPGANEPTLHIIVEQPPSKSYSEEQPEERASATPAAQAPTAPDVQPGEPTVLVFRNGHHQEVTSYAIMGDAVYVFDQGRRKIALSELDVPATVKANDDHGMEFRLPPGPKNRKATTTLPQSASPDRKNDQSGKPSNIAAVMP